MDDVDLLDRLGSARLLAIVRGTDPRAAAATVRTLVAEGVDVVEVSLTTPGALDVVAEVRHAVPATAVIGIGTAVSVDDVDAACAAGASFVVSPCLVPSVARAVDIGVPILAGALTPTEVRTATTAGATAVKLFPASHGGPGYLRALRDPFPDIPFVPVGGIDPELARTYLRLGARAVGIGSPLIGDAASGGSLTALRERARRCLEAVRDPDG